MIDAECQPESDPEGILSAVLLCRSPRGSRHFAFPRVQFLVTAAGERRCSPHGDSMPAVRITLSEADRCTALFEVPHNRPRGSHCLVGVHKTVEEFVTSCGDCILSPWHLQFKPSASSRDSVPGCKRRQILRPMQAVQFAGARRALSDDLTAGDHPAAGQAAFQENSCCQPRQVGCPTAPY